MTRNVEWAHTDSQNVPGKSGKYEIRVNLAESRGKYPGTRASYTTVGGEPEAA